MLCPTHNSSDRLGSDYRFPRNRAGPDGRVSVKPSALHKASAKNCTTLVSCPTMAERITPNTSKGPQESLKRVRLASCKYTTRRRRAFAPSQPTVGQSFGGSSTMSRKPSLHMAVRAAIAIIELQHTDSELSLKDVAKQVKLSPSHFCRLLRKQTGKGFRDHLDSSRFSSALVLLGNPLLRIKEVAAASGFSSVSTFDRYFRRLHGCTPTEWRDQMHNHDRGVEP